MLRRPLESALRSGIGVADQSVADFTYCSTWSGIVHESVMGIFKTELHRNPAALATNGGPWRGLDDLEIATCAWVSWFNEERRDCAAFWLVRDVMAASMPAHRAPSSVVRPSGSRRPAAR